MKGEVAYLYAFDVANEIAIGKVQGLPRHVLEPLEIRADHTLPKDIPFYKPMAIHPGSLDIQYEGQPVLPVVHVYEVGIISVILRIPFEVQQLHDLLPFHAPVLAKGQGLDHVAQQICAKICADMSDALIKPSPLLDPEAYTVFCVTEIPGQQNLEQWFTGHSSEIAELLTENKPGVLSGMQVEEVLRMKHSYTQKDMAIIDWDAALVVELNGYIKDVLYVLELANLQLEEYKVMDKRLDLYLDKAYEDIKEHRFAWSRSYLGILRKLRELRMDITKLNDEVTHITKFLGDWYLARVYLAARERFHLRQWRSSVEERLKQLDTMYTVVHTEIANLRMLWLEAIIVIFFAIDILAVFLLKK
jgi:hypothetical protein